MYKWELVAVVPIEEVYKRNERDMVPPDKLYSSEEERRIMDTVYKAGPDVYESGPFLERHVGDIFDEDQLWPEECPEEEYAGIYRLIYIED